MNGRFLFNEKNIELSKMYFKWCTKEFFIIFHSKKLFFVCRINNLYVNAIYSKGHESSCEKFARCCQDVITTTNNNIIALNV